MTTVIHSRIRVTATAEEIPIIMVMRTMESVDMCPVAANIFVAYQV